MPTGPPLSLWLIPSPQFLSHSSPGPPCFSSWNKEAQLGGCERCSLLPVKRKPDAGLGGNPAPALPGPCPLTSFLENTAGREPARCLGPASRWRRSSFARQVLGQWDLGALVFWGQSCPRKRSLLQNFLSLTSGPHPTLFLLHRDRGPDVSPGPDLPRGDRGRQGEKGR